MSVTSIAGPGGGSGEKPVGTVCVVWPWPDGSLEHNFACSRETARRCAVRPWKSRFHVCGRGPRKAGLTELSGQKGYKAAF
jgi:nicotinamide mononucleotide (NMN) deamidase PncC